MAAVVAVFVLTVAPRVSLVPGDSHDGRNAGLWGVGARSLIENGPIESRLGAWAPERGVYANHPPGVTLETAVFIAVTGDGPWSRKAPAVLSSIAAIGLGVVLLRRLGFSRAASMAGVAVMAATPMMQVFGASPNMEAVSLPWVMLVLIAWADPAHPRARLAAAAGVVGCVWTFHGSLLLAFVVGALSLVQLLRRRESGIDRTTVAWALPAGLALGAWFAWANGGLGGLLSQGGERSSLDGVGLADWLDRQRLILGDVYGWPVLLVAVVGIAVAIRTLDGHRRIAVMLGAAVPLIYLALTIDGAHHHEYWNYLFLAPVAIGCAVVADLKTSDDGPVLLRWAPLALVAVLAVGALSTKIPAHSLFADGADAATLLQQTDLPAGQTTAVTYPLIVEPLSWVQFETGLSTQNLYGPDHLAAWAAGNPTDLVLVGEDGVRHLHDDAMWDTVVALAAGRVMGEYAMVTAADLSTLASSVGLDPALPDANVERLRELAAWSDASAAGDVG